MGAGSAGSCAGHRHGRGTAGRCPEDGDTAPLSPLRTNETELPRWARLWVPLCIRNDHNLGGRSRNPRVSRADSFGTFRVPAQLLAGASEPELPSQSSTKPVSVSLCLSGPVSLCVSVPLLPLYRCQSLDLGPTLNGHDFVSTAHLCKEPVRKHSHIPTPLAERGFCGALLNPLHPSKRDMNKRILRLKTPHP